MKATVEEIMLAALVEGKCSFLYVDDSERVWGRIKQFDGFWAVDGEFTIRYTGESPIEALNAFFSGEKISRDSLDWPLMQPVWF